MGETRIFTIENKSNNISADLNAIVSNTNTEYFKVTSNLSESIIEPQNGKVILKITVELIKLPVKRAEKTNISIKISANPQNYN